MKVINILVAADHGGFALKEKLLPWLKEQKFMVEVFGAFSLDTADDYPPLAQAVAKKIEDAKQPVDRDPETMGILLCRTGAGMAIVANRFEGVRAVVCHDIEEAKAARTDNNANVLVLDADNTNLEEIQKIFLTFTSTKFAGGRHERRLEEFQ